MRCRWGWRARKEAGRGKAAQRNQSAQKMARFRQRTKTSVCPRASHGIPKGAGQLRYVHEHGSLTNFESELKNAARTKRSRIRSMHGALNRTQLVRTLNRIAPCLA